jgi:hypothetical protein
MFSNELKRHFGEFRRAILGHKYEQHANGIFIPGAAVIVGGQYAYQTNKGGWSDWEKNLLPTEGLNFMLDLVGNDVAVAASYITLHGNSTTVLAAHTAATYAATYAECSGSEGYTEAARVLWAPAAAASAVKHNNASPAEFNINTASTLTVNGVALLTSSTKGGTGGVLISASKFSAARTFSDADIFDVKYQLGLTSS